VLPAERAQGATEGGRAALRTPLVVVIDTNVWLDLFVFHDPASQALAHALRRGSLQPVRNQRTDAELLAVLARPQFVAKLPSAATANLLRHWQELARGVPESPAAPWVCGDPADQKFLDLAYGARARALFTKDRALLRLARAARRDGLQIIGPGALRDLPALDLAKPA